MQPKRNRKGIAVVMALLFLALFTSLAAAFVSLSSGALQITANYHKASSAKSAAESGAEVIRYWLNRVSLPGTTTSGQLFSSIATSLQNDLTANSISNITIASDGSMITIGDVVLNTAYNQHFSATITQYDLDTLQLEVVGTSDNFRKGIRVFYDLSERGHSVFDYGVATRGPLSLTGNVELEGINLAVESSVYIESENSYTALTIIGNSHIAGDVSVANQYASVVLQGSKAGIGGETGQAAIDNHVNFGVDPTEFPTPTPDIFEQYVQTTIDSTYDFAANATYDNIRIPANLNPHFTGNVNLRGVVYIKTPNVVTFSGNVDLTGVIVGDGDVSDNSAANSIIITGNVSSRASSELPDEPQFEGLKDKNGTFIVAPGFALAFGGNFNMSNGAIAGNGITFFGNAGGTVHGSIINYSDAVMTINGNSDLYFNRSGCDIVPAGFVPDIVLEYNARSYEEFIPQG